jgi:hypothetical protein
LLVGLIMIGGAIALVGAGGPHAAGADRLGASRNGVKDLSQARAR